MRQRLQDYGVSIYLVAMTILIAYGLFLCGNLGLSSGNKFISNLVKMTCLVSSSHFL